MTLETFTQRKQRSLPELKPMRWKRSFKALSCSIKMLTMLTLRSTWFTRPITRVCLQGCRVICLHMPSIISISMRLQQPKPRHSLRHLSSSVTLRLQKPQLLSFNRWLSSKDSKLRKNFRWWHCLTLPNGQLIFSSTVAQNVPLSLTELKLTPSP